MDNQMPSVFIGSSTEGLDIAREIELQLQRDADTTIWKDDVFKPGSGVLETLIDLVQQFDYAVMVLSPDDHLESRGQELFSPRDNVVFELGLFMGRLGRSRVFVVHEENAVLKLPSDLAGITLLSYRDRVNQSAALSIPSTLIIKAIRANGFSEFRTHQNLQRLEGRQNATESRLRTLQVVIKGLVTEFEYQKLRGLASSDRFWVQFHNSMMQELNRLDAIRFLRPRPGFGIESIREQDGSDRKFDLRQYVEITNDGLEYLGLRDELLKP